MQTIKEKIEERKKGKTNINITIDKILKDKLIKYKQKEGIPQLSPMINEILWNWLNNEK